MRDRLRYRAWDKENKRYIYGVEKGLQFYSTAGNLRVMTLAEIEESDKYDLEQCTGIRDYLHKLIYEGDIIKNLRTRNSYYKVVAETNDYSFKFVGDNDSEKISCFEKHAVIGNIHENKELSEATND